ncbi:MAG: serine protease, partial [Notoacmeibacter sp.]
MSRLSCAALACFGLAALPASAEDQNSVFSKFLNGLAGDSKVTASTEIVQKRTPFGQGEIQLSFAPLVKQTAPAVVNVYAERMARQRTSPFEGDPFFEQFFGRK